MADNFYPLTNEEWLQSFKELKPAELLILYHLRSINPFGDRPVNVGVRELSRQLDLSPSTVSRALKRLETLGYIEFELVEIELKKVITKGILSDNCGKVLSPGNSVVSRQQQRSKSNTDDQKATATIEKQHLASETQSTEGFYLSKIDQRSDQTLKDLSDPPTTPERDILDDEELIEWVAKQNQQARNPRAYAIKCLRSNKKYWQNKYQEYLNRTNIPPQIIQENENLSEVERPSEEESVLGRLQCLWALPRKRQECIRRVEEHPEWGIKIDPDLGPVRVEEPVQAEAEAEDTAERFSPLGKILESMKLQQVKEPEDLGDLITMIGFHLKRLGMSKVEAIARMIHYGWPPTHPAILSGNLAVCHADDLLDLQEVLEGL